MRLFWLKVAVCAGCLAGTAAAAPYPADELPARVRVVPPLANVRSQATLQSAVVATVRGGDVLEVRGREGDWYEVVVPPGNRGFISVRLVAPHQGTTPAPARTAPTPAAAAPTPAPAPLPEPRRVEPAAPPPLTRSEAPQAAPTLKQKKGDREILAFANLYGLRSSGSDFGGGGTSAFGMVFFNYGKFLSARNEIGGGPSITVSSGAGAGVSGVFGFNVFYRRYFPSKTGVWYPYVGSELFVQDLSGPEGGNILDATYFQITGGAKNYLSEQLALDLKASLGVGLGDPGGAQIFQGTVGLTYVF